ncbi:hypothetical protein LQV05_000149 [Cryptococcus neoformans]|nr:hypothetical protein LQV05_000149 [Cryptococcus neoformans]
MGEVYEGESLAESSRAPKVNQLDADELDDALVSMLGEKVLRSIDNFKSRASWDFKPEIELFAGSQTPELEAYPPFSTRDQNNTIRPFAVFTVSPPNIPLLPPQKDKTACSI